jgi:hypothetical protein
MAGGNWETVVEGYSVVVGHEDFGYVLIAEWAGGLIGNIIFSKESNVRKSNQTPAVVLGIDNNFHRPARYASTSSAIISSVMAFVCGKV